MGFHFTPFSYTSFFNSSTHYSPPLLISKRCRISSSKTRNPTHNHQFLKSMSPQGYTTLSLLIHSLPKMQQQLFLTALYPLLKMMVKKQLHSYAGNASERSNIYLKALLSEDKSTAYDLISQAEPIAQSGSDLLDHINLVQEGVKWESRHGAGDLKNMETPIMGMKMALTAISSFPVVIIEEIKTVLQSARVNQMLKLELAKCFLPFHDAVTDVPQRKDELFDESIRTLVTISPTRENLPVFFFLSCFEMLITNSNTYDKPLDGQKVNTAQKTRVEKIVGQSIADRIVFALKCSIALGLAVLLGMFFDKKNGYWSGLTIAISFVEGRLPVFTVANNRVHGTAIGSVYGVLGSCLLQQVPELRFVILVPWIVFTSMLHHSKMYGESGGISAVIGALLILGRKNYGPPKQFAIARLTEVSIGLFCMVLLEIILQPVRAATVVKLQVSQSLGTLDECLNHISSPKENIRKLKSDLKGLKNRINDAKSEPSFWFLPFQASCYDKVREGLSKMVDLMQIMTYNIEFISSLSQSSDGGWKEIEQHINGNLKILKESTSPSVKCLQKITQVRSNETFDRHLQESEGFLDLEAGNQPIEEVAMKVMDAFVLHLKEVTDKIQSGECKRKVILHMNSLGFCIASLVGETMQVERCIKEIIRCENPKPQVGFEKLCYKNNIANAP